MDLKVRQLFVSVGFFTSIPFLILSESPLRADVKMPAIFGDHMVLQQEAKLPVWGWADPGEAVAVTLGKSTAKTKAGTDGKWRVDLAPLSVNSAPQTLTIAGKNTLTFQDVLIGDVWICAGQSNMEYGVNKVEAAELANPQIRIFLVTKNATLTPQENVGETAPERPWIGTWQVCTPEMLAKDGSWGGFSAVGSYFARDIFNATKRPVGMIGSYWGGTPAQAWTSLSALGQDAALVHHANDFQNLPPDQQSLFPANWVLFDVAAQKYNSEIGDVYNRTVLRPWQQAVEAAKVAGEPEPPAPEPPSSPPPRNPGNIATPSTLFNGMINPLIPYAIKGAIWYQGESNAFGGNEYTILFPAMINDWRARWNQGDFPFLFVQLASFGKNENESWPLLRESQLKTLSLPNTGMAVAVDIGDPQDIHPRDKADVGARLALAARHVAYGEKNVYSGPIYDSLKVEGNKIRLSFKHTGGGLKMGTPPWTPNGQPAPMPTQLTGFEIAGDDQNWVASDAVINGANVVVSSSAVTAPVAVRYAWANSPNGNLYNKEGLPASPFRTNETP